VRIGLISDSHGELDPALFTYLEACDEVWHAGDLGGGLDVLRRLEAFKRLRAVYGNIDGAGVRSALPAEIVWDCEGVKVFLTHIGGYPGHYDRAAKAAILRHRPDLFISGHSHILKVMRDPSLGLLHMNPGACGHYGWHKVRTALRFTIGGAKISRVEAIELGPRSRKAAAVEKKS
jgi:putative phosphoesterase